uniref:Uncharacterized protein n=1 Tax=viral metagenome TaxID=1070528 RepID=A0A6C0KZX5_9ZZZZ|tara:strand:+ start:21583 stop:22269 length:687 start_codon:yes stop_codon:yes gene_type:complete
MFELKSDDLVRIERSSYINGHFYLKFKNRENSEMTLGFGYDEPFFEKNPLWLKPLIVHTRMFSTLIEPVKNKWVVYHNDHARNNKLVPNVYHIISNWFILSEKTIKIINQIIKEEDDDDSWKKLFELPFCASTIEKSSNSCRTIIIDVIKDSLREEGINTLNKYFHGNPALNDIKYGCITLEIKNGKVSFIESHPCVLVNINKCCCLVSNLGLEKKNKVVRKPVFCDT